MTRFQLPRLMAILAVPFLLAAPAAGAANGDDADGDARALQAITRMADYLSNLEEFGLTLDIGYDIVQEWGQLIEFGETRTVTVRRPDHIRVDATNRDGTVSGLFFDGEQIAFFDSADEVYATTAKAGSIDDAISYFVNDLGMPLPMGGMLSGHLPSQIKGWATDIAYVEQSTIGGVACDHVALRGDWEDVQLWIAQGDKPLLQRIVITYKRAEGKPQFRAQVRDWNFSPDVKDSVFAFTPPEGSARIAFAPRGKAPQMPGAGEKAAQP